MTQPEDDLVVRAIASDEFALTCLLERFGLSVRNELSINEKWRSLIDPDDVMQITYLEAFLRIGNLKSTTTAGFVAWLRSIAGNNLRDAIRSLECDKRSHPRAGLPIGQDSYTSLLEEVCAGSTTPSRVAGQREVQQFVEDALRKLPRDYEKVIRLCELECKTAPEAATILGRSHGSVRMLLSRAKDRLREVLSLGPALFGDTA